jgi:hypothetical protein
MILITSDVSHAKYSNLKKEIVPLGTMTGLCHLIEVTVKITKELTISSKYPGCLYQITKVESKKHG